MKLKPVNPQEKDLRSALLGHLKEQLSGWRKDATGKQVQKMRGIGAPAPKPFAEGGAVEAPKDEEDADQRSPGEPSEEEEDAFEGDDAENPEFPGPSDDTESDVEVEGAVDGEPRSSNSLDSIIRMLKR